MFEIFSLVAFCLTLSVASLAVKALKREVLQDSSKRLPKSFALFFFAISTSSGFTTTIVLFGALLLQENNNSTKQNKIILLIRL